LKIPKKEVPDFQIRHNGHILFLSPLVRPIFPDGYRRMEKSGLGVCLTFNLF